MVWDLPGTGPGSGDVQTDRMRQRVCDTWEPQSLKNAFRVHTEQGIPQNEEDPDGFKLRKHRFRKRTVRGRPVIATGKENYMGDKKARTDLVAFPSFQKFISCCKSNIYI
jgi:hypothetical protein